MTTKEKLLELLNDLDFEPHINTAPELLPNLSEKQEEVIERMYSKYIGGE